VFCSKCGTALTPESTFCGACGTPVPPRTLASPAVVPTAVTPYPTLGGVVLTRTPTYAGFWLRFLAYIIDGLILSPLFILFVVIGLGMTGGLAHIISVLQRNGEEVDPAAVAMMVSMFFTFIAIAILISWLYAAYLESGEKQATWGKQALGLYVTDLNGQRISFGRASGRFFAKTFVTRLIPLEIGFIMAAFTDRRQALHDMIAATLVLKH
jgi:uncharacterized RDD family membrane protein YckC